LIKLLSQASGISRRSGDGITVFSDSDIVVAQFLGQLLAQMGMGMEHGRATDFLCSLAVDVFELGLAESQHCVRADRRAGCLAGFLCTVMGV
jgi:hypothetical protein